MDILHSRDFIGFGFPARVLVPDQIEQFTVYGDIVNLIHANRAPRFRLTRPPTSLSLSLYIYIQQIQLRLSFKDLNLKP